MEPSTLLTPLLLLLTLPPLLFKGPPWFPQLFCPPITSSPPLPYSRCQLLRLRKNYRLSSTALSSAQSAGILISKRYLHRGPKHNRHLQSSITPTTPTYNIQTTHPRRPPSTGPRRTVNLANLKPLQRAPITPPSHSSNFALLNTRSLNNKAPILHELILDNSLDFLLLTETWQQPNDFFSLNQASPPNFGYLCKPRPSRRGGGLAVLFNKNLRTTELTFPTVTSFESLAFKTCSNTVILIYRPPKPNSSFLSDLSELLIVASSLPLPLLLLGDFNIHMDSPTCKLASDFSTLLDNFNLTQHITFPTHNKGHILDLVCSANVPVLNIQPSPFPLSDHKLIQFTIPSPSPRLKLPRVISFRNIKSIDPLHLSDLLSAALHLDPPPTSPDDLTNHLNATLSASLNSLAPLRTKTVSFNTSSPWFTPHLRKLKQTGRQLERLWRKSSLTVHLEAYKSHLITYKDAITAAKSDYFSTIINDPTRNPRTLFSTVNTLLKPRANTLSDPSPDLCNSFLQFFSDKITTINNSLLPVSDPAATTPTPFLSIPLDPLTPPPQHRLSRFDPVDSATIAKLISTSKPTTCSLDPLPTPLLKSCLPVLCPYLTDLFNSSLSHGTVPSAFKTAAVTPTLKKPGLDPSCLNHYRPISNLPFLSKTLERLVSTQLQSHLHSNNLLEPLQSGFRPLHSTETALLQVLNNLLTSADTGALNILILLDLSAAFDTVSHNILLTRLQDLGIEGTALSWLQSYLTNRSHFISLHNNSSATSTVTQGVPQGSVLGPLLFIIYLFPLGQILRHFNLDFHCYADDTQIYLSTNTPHNPPLSHINSCLSAIKAWMQQNFLKLNSDKTQLLLIGSKSTLTKTNNLTLNIDGTSVSPSPQARNLGVIFDSTLSLEPHIRQLVKISFFHLRNIAKIRPSLTPPTAEKLIHAFISSRLDYCNSLLYGISNTSINKLQLVQNAAARLLTHTKSWHHITPVLKDLHWLPVSHRISYKILTLTYKALHQLAPPYLSELLSPYQPQRSLRSTSAGLLSTPTSKLRSFGDRAFSRAAPKLWNSLPNLIRDSDSLTTFQSRLKTHLFSSAYP
ncbi:uncharacterized protein LOC141758790 [Sebastes fasciatus]|uniref:uncharacterized protein LOC141758790 n=1 Tax=Sebastes fasciatus TaxID=394691 RepID=UPI003D9E6764